MRVLIIGGTGTISTAVSQKTIEKGYELYLFTGKSLALSALS